METLKTNWSGEEFLAYTLMYSAYSDFIFTNEEKEWILSKVNTETYKKVKKELEKDNDYQSIQKILAYTQNHKYNENDIAILLHEIEALLNCDEDYDILKQNLMMNLTKLFKLQLKKK